MVMAWAYGHDVSRLDTRSEGAISETGDANPRLSAEKILALPCGKTQMAMPRLDVRRVPDRALPALKIQMVPCHGCFDAFGRV